MMIEFLVFILFIVVFLVFILFIVVLIIRSRLVKRMISLEMKLTNTEDELRIATNRIQTLENQAGRQRPMQFEIAVPSNTTYENEPTKVTAVSEKLPAPKAEPVYIQEKLCKVMDTDTDTDKRSMIWEKLEKQIAENWTGIIGTVVLVLGIGFLGVYTALRMTEFFRFLMIVGCAAVLESVFFVLRKREKWIKPALWMRSAGGAVFLFACLGAGGIPGLHWIQNPILGLSFLLFGISVNLYFAVIGGKQVFASLHVLLGLIALAIAPQNETTLLIAFGVALFGVALTFREKWDYHLLLSITSFFVYNVYWYSKMSGKVPLTESQNVLGIILVSVICISAACMHYRKLYGAKEFEKIPFIVHLLNWAYLGLGLFMYMNGMKWKTIPLFLAAAAAFVLANHARKLNIRWLHCTDTLIAQILTIIGFISLTNWGMSGDIVLMIVFFETLVFTRVVILVDEELLYRAGIILSHSVCLMEILLFVVTGSNGTDMNSIRLSVLALICATGCLAFHWNIARLKDSRWILFDFFYSVPFNEREEFSITGVITGLFLLCGMIFAPHLLWFHYVFICAVLALLVIRERIGTFGITCGVVPAVLGIFVTTWNILYRNPTHTSIESLALGLPLFLVSLTAIRWDYLRSINQHAKWFGIYIFTLHFMVMTHVFFKPVSPLIPGMCWLITSLLYLELALFISNKNKGNTNAIGMPDRYLLHSGYVLLGAFFFRHIFVHLQSEEYIGFLKVRFGIEAIALAVLIYWALAKRPKGNQRQLSWICLHPLFSECIAVFAILTISVEINKYWHPLIWIASAFGTLYLGKVIPRLSRMKAYSVLFYWTSIFQVTFLLGVYDKLGTYWYERDWILGSTAIAAQFVFLVIFLKTGTLSNLSFPLILAGLNKVFTKVHEKRNIALFYPLLICVALFLNWTFAKSLLTLLFVLECFTVFVISIVLKEQHFRYVALAGLVLCIVRLIFFDLARSTTLIKAFVFLGVGLIMLGMHALYNRFKERLFEEKMDEVT